MVPVSQVTVRILNKKPPTHTVLATGDSRRPALRCRSRPGFRALRSDCPGFESPLHQSLAVGFGGKRSELNELPAAD